MLIVFVLSVLNADQKIPLAPPSSVVLSLDEMILHFKIFIISDLFKKISNPKDINLENSFQLNDIEMDVLISKAIKKETMLTNNKLELFFLKSELYIHLEDKFFKCFRLEVLPEQFDYQIEPITEKYFFESQNVKNHISGVIK